MPIFNLFSKKIKPLNPPPTEDPEIEQFNVFNTTDFNPSNTIPSKSLEKEIQIFTYETCNVNCLDPFLLDMNALCFYGDKDQIKKGMQPLNIQNLSSVLIINKMQDLDSITSSVKFIFLYCKPNNALEFLISIVKKTNLPQHIVLILPSNNTGWLKINKEEFGKPIVYARTPCAGSTRLTCQIHAALYWSRWRELDYTPFSSNFRFLNWINKNKLNMNIQMLDNALQEKVKELNYFDCMGFHEWSSLPPSLESEEFKVIFLMRDPRDLITSFYWFVRTLQDFPVQQGLQQLLDGFCLTQHNTCANYNFYWPSIDEIFDIYIKAMERKNTHVIKYEDLKTDNTKAIKTLLTSVNLIPSLFYNYKDSDWEHLKHISSFKYHTNGQKTEGKHNKNTYDFKNPTSCRKGIIGDWKNTFPKNIADEFHAKYTDKLRILGY